MKKKYWIRVEEDAYNWVVARWQGSFTKWLEDIYNKVMQSKVSRQFESIADKLHKPQEQNNDIVSRQYTDNQIAYVKSLKLKAKNEYTDSDWFTISLEKFLEINHKDKENLRPLIIELS